MFWCMQRTNIYLEARQTELLDGIAAQEGVSRAEVIRRIIDRALAGSDDDLTAGLTAIDQSFGVLEEADVPVRDSGDRERHLARMWKSGSRSWSTPTFSSLICEESWRPETGCGRPAWTALSP